MPGVKCYLTLVMRGYSKINLRSSNCCDNAGWLSCSLGFNMPNLIGIATVEYDPVNGCVSIDYALPVNAWARWYSLSWTTIYPIALICALGFNASAVIKLRSNNLHLNAPINASSVVANIGAGSRADAKSKSSQRDTLKKQMASLSLQRVSISLAFSFAFTSALLNIITAIQMVTGE